MVVVDVMVVLMAVEKMVVEMKATHHPNQNLETLLLRSQNPH